MHPFDHIEVSFNELERCLIYLDSIEIMKNRVAYDMCVFFAKEISVAMLAGIPIRIIDPGAESTPQNDRWLLPLTEMSKSRCESVLHVFRLYAKRFNVPYRPERLFYLF